MRKKTLITKAGIKKLLAGTISGSIIASSCTPLAYRDVEEPIIEDESENNSLISMSLHLSESQKDYLTFLGNLIEDIIEDKEVATRFNANPNEYLAKHGYNNKISINLNDPHLKVFLALGDSEIREKIDSEDISGFIKICKEKGYLKHIKVGNVSSINKTNTDKEISESDIPINIPEHKLDKQSVFFLVPFYVGAFFYYYYYFSTVTTTKVHYNTSVASMGVNPYEKIPAVFHVYTLTGDMEKAYIACDKYLEEESKNVVEELKKETPLRFSDSQEELKMQNTIKYNILKLQEEL